VSNVIQSIRNFLIRIVALFSIILKFFTGFIKKIFGFFGGLTGLTPTNYFLEPDEAQGTGVKRNEEKQLGEKQPVINERQPIVKEQNKTTPAISETPSTNSQRKAKVDDYFLNMARDVKKS
jgi:hypothetical protein